MPHHITQPRRAIGLALGLLVLGAALLALLAGDTQPAGAAPPSASAAPGSELWRLGITSEGSALYDAVIGRLVSADAVFRSNRDVTDIYHIFPAPAHTRTVSAAALYITTRSGSYAGNATLALEVRGLDGSLKHTASASPIDLEAAATGAWANIALAAAPANLTIEPGEYLALHFALDGAAGGDLDVRPIFEVVVE